MSSQLWDTPSIAPPGDLSKLSLRELSDWLSKLQTAISRHEFLRSPKGRTLMIDQVNERILALQQQIHKFTDWVENRSESSLRSLLAMQKNASRVYEERASQKRARAEQKQSSTKKAQTTAQRFGIDDPIMQDLLKQAGVSRETLLAKLS